MDKKPFLTLLGDDHSSSRDLIWSSGSNNKIRRLATSISMGSPFNRRYFWKTNGGEWIRCGSADDAYVGAKAVWEVASLKEIFLSRTSPSSIGFSSLGGILSVTPSEDSKGTHIHIGAGGKEVLAPIAPGVIRRIPIASCRQFNLRDAIPINCDADNMIALDGEREINAYQGDKLTVRLNPEGPWVVDVAGVLSIASINKYFITNG